MDPSAIVGVPRAAVNAAAEFRAIRTASRDPRNPIRSRALTACETNPPVRTSPPRPVSSRPVPSPTPESFIARWSAASGSERADHQLFVTELCTLLDVPRPDPARDDTHDNA